MRDEIIINGVKYDAKTGKALGKVEEKGFENFDAKKIHSNLQKSQTLNRKFVRRPENLSNSQLHAIEQFKRRHDYIEARKASRIQAGEVSHSRISKFEGVHGSASRVIAPISAQKSPAKIEKIEDETIAPVQIHPVHEKALAKMREQKIEKSLPTSLEIKESAISEALEKSREISKKSRGIRKQNFFSRKMAGFFAGCAVCGMAFGYLVYLNLPNISTRVAAVQSGIDATLPQYVAQGYNLQSLASFDGRTVNLSYKNANDSYVVKQAKTSWDSVALLENYVEKNWANDYSTYREKGLTIYENRNNEATWVNNGKIYTISGGKNLTDAEIRKIATSF